MSQKVGQDLSPHRFRANIWVDDLGPWEEFEWLGKTLRIGGAVFEGVERIQRCKATMTNPTTGRRDADTLGRFAGGLEPPRFWHLHEGGAGRRYCRGRHAGYNRLMLPFPLAQPTPPQIETGRKLFAGTCGIL